MERWKEKQKEGDIEEQCKKEKNMKKQQEKSCALGSFSDLIDNVVQ